LSAASEPEIPSDWSPDGQLLLYTRNSAQSGPDVWVMAADDGSSARALLASTFDESDARFSPDGRAIAYVSNESGRSEVYVRTFPDLSRKLQVSTSGGTEPVWSSPDRLYFRAPDGLFETTVRSGSFLRAGTSRRLFKLPSEDLSSGSEYDVDRSSGRWVGISDQQPDELRITRNWLSSIRARLATVTQTRPTQ
jgi:serine/threonine-protein kinase